MFSKMTIIYQQHETFASVMEGKINFSTPFAKTQNTVNRSPPFSTSQGNHDTSTPSTVKSNAIHFNAIRTVAIFEHMFAAFCSKLFCNHATSLSFKKEGMTSVFRMYTGVQPSLATCLNFPFMYVDLSLYLCSVTTSQSNGCAYGYRCYPEYC